MRIVVKVGTQIIAGAHGLSLKKIGGLMGEISNIINMGHQVILVSSGAVGAGLPAVPYKGNSKDSFRKKIAAAIGQPLLMHDYIREAKKRKLAVAQILILSEDFTNREHFKNFVLNIEAMLSHGVLPIINENDVMKREDLRIGDNDSLSAEVAVGLRADKLIILTNQEGLYTANPDRDKNAKLVRIVEKVDSKIENFCSQRPSKLGRGGMITKVRAAKYATEGGVETYIGSGDKRDIIFKAVRKTPNGFPGTTFKKQKIKRRKKKII